MRLRLSLLVFVPLVLAACDDLTGPEIVRRLAEAEDALEQRGDDSFARHMLGPAAAFASRVRVDGLPGSSQAYALVVETRLVSDSTRRHGSSSWSLVVWRREERVYLSAQTREVPAHIPPANDSAWLDWTPAVSERPSARLVVRPPDRGKSGIWTAVGGDFDVAAWVDGPDCGERAIVLHHVKDDVPEGCEPAEYDIQFDGRFREEANPTRAEYGVPIEFLPGERRVRVPRQRVRGVVAVLRCDVPARERPSGCDSLER